MIVIKNIFQGVSKHFDSKCEKASRATYKPFDAIKSEVFGFWMIFEAFWFAVLAWTPILQRSPPQKKSSDLFKRPSGKLIHLEKISEGDQANLSERRSVKKQTKHTK